MRSATWLALAALATLAAFGQRPDLPQGDKASSYAAKAVKDGYEASILLPADVTPLKVTSLETQIEPWRVSTKTISDGEGKPRKLIVKVKDGAVPTGSYSMLLRATHSTKGKKAETYEYPIAVTIPPVTVEGLPAKVKLEQTSYGFMTRCSRECSVPVVLTPTKDGDWLTGVKATQVGGFVLGSNPTRGAVSLSVAPAGNRTGGTPTVTIRAAGDFDLGESEGKIRITADQLAAPVVLAVTVVKRLTSLALIPVLAVGLLLGWLVRVRQVEAINQKRLQVDASELDQMIVRDLGGAKDDKLVQALEAVRKSIADGFNAKSATLKTSLVTWAAAREKALREFEERKALFVADTKSLHGMLNRSFDFPAGFAEPVGRAKAELEQLLLVPGNDLGSAEKKKDLVEGEVKKALGAAARARQEEWSWRSDAMENVHALLEAADASKAAEDWKKAQEVHKGIEAATGPDGVSRENLAPLLNAVHWEERFWPKYAAGISDGLRAFVAGMDLELSERGYGESPEWVAWKQRAESVAGAMASGSWRGMAERLRALRDELERLMREWGKDVEEKDRAAFLSALDSNKFVEAVRKLPLKDVDAVAGGEEEEVGAGVSRSGAVRRVGEVEEAREGAAPAVAVARAVALPDLVRRELAALEMWQRWILWVLITFVGWAVLSPSFTGSTGNFLSAFAWAFLTDVTVENMVQAFGGLKPK